MKFILDATIKEILNKRLLYLESLFKSDVAFYYGSIFPSLEKVFRDFIEELKNDSDLKVKNEILTVILNTPGGSVETVEKLVNVIRSHYKEINFVVPDYAMSAGTVFCMSGDKIYMDYSSSLGPIDPQVHNGKDWVPALGYLDKVDEMIEKSRNGKLTNAEYLILRDQDLATLRKYEMAKNLTVSLLEEWLVKYKFKNWNVHKTNPAKKNQPVTEVEKRERAKKIAVDLGDNKIWHSHGRFIGIDLLKNLLKLEIEDYSKISNMQKAIREYNDLICEYINKNKIEVFFHSRKFI
jgi:hypothetical protein